MPYNVFTTTTLDPPAAIHSATQRVVNQTTVGGTSNETRSEERIVSVKQNLLTCTFYTRRISTSFTQTFFDGETSFSGTNVFRGTTSLNRFGTTSSGVFSDNFTTFTTSTESTRNPSLGNITISTTTQITETFNGNNTTVLTGVPQSGNTFFRKWTTDTAIFEDTTEPFTFTFFVNSTTTADITTITFGNVGNVVTRTVNIPTQGETANTFTCNTTIVQWPLINETLYAINFTDESSLERSVFELSDFSTIESFLSPLPLYGSTVGTRQGFGMDSFKTTTRETLTLTAHMTQLSGRETDTTTTQFRVFASNQYSTTTSSFFGNFTGTTESTASRVITDGLELSRAITTSFTSSYSSSSTTESTISEIWKTFTRSALTTVFHTQLTLTRGLQFPFVAFSNQLFSFNTNFTKETDYGMTVTFTSSDTSPQWGFTTASRNTTGSVEAYWDHAKVPSEDMNPPFGMGFAIIDNEWSNAARAINYSVVYAERVAPNTGTANRRAVFAPISGGLSRVGTFGTNSDGIFSFTGTSWSASMETDTALFSKIYTTLSEGLTVTTTETSSHVFSNLITNNAIFYKSATYGHWFFTATLTLDGAFDFTSSNLTNGQSTTGSSLLQTSNTITIEPKNIYFAVRKRFLIASSATRSQGVLAITA